MSPLTTWIKYSLRLFLFFVWLIYSNDCSNVSFDSRLYAPKEQGLLIVFTAVILVSGRYLAADSQSVFAVREWFSNFSWFREVGSIYSWGRHVTFRSWAHQQSVVFVPRLIYVCCLGCYYFIIWAVIMLIDEGSVERELFLWTLKVESKALKLMRQ